MHRDADGPRLIGDAAGDGLPDPPGGVGGKFVAAAIFEFFHGLHQAHVAFLDQVEERQAAVGVFFGDGDDETQVGLDHFGFGLEGPGGKFAQAVKGVEVIRVRHPDKFLERLDFLPFGFDQVPLGAGFALRLGVGQRAQAVLQFVVDVFGNERHFLDHLVFAAEFGKRPLQFLVRPLERRQRAGQLWTW